MKTIQIIGVPEHFNYPWIQLVNEQPLLEKGIKLAWKDESKGSGAMNKAIREKEADIAIILTESFIKDKIEGNPGKIIGYHVLSPLTWGVHVPAKAGVKTVNQLQHTPFLISRYGSGSHLMTYLLAKEKGWQPESLQFEVVGNMDGAKDAFADQKPKGFLWEKYTTKPFVDEGYFDRIGEIPTPWPCFVLVAQEELVDSHENELKLIQDLIYQKSMEIRKQDNLSQILSEAYGIQEPDISAWLEQTTWATNNQLSTESLNNTMDILFELGLIKEKTTIENLTAKELVDLI
ncbi:ABC transporter substrate-binding protein [Echinicola marina]|uniref:ABC transporter substrate-binding protein n=1 Tax=Echinicola marina TaxID=2859768 RepID=UPI001CF6E21A|nr:ABC transporter substrate-binding protein [Echinicola marina]UCS91903.1 ABC transporter substrate-binding protein [Echinicola marina]